jgi:hypothetical protein
VRGSFETGRDPHHRSARLHRIVHHGREARGRARPFLLRPRREKNFRRPGCREHVALALPQRYPIDLEQRLVAAHPGRATGREENRAEGRHWHRCSRSQGGRIRQAWERRLPKRLLRPCHHGSTRLQEKDQSCPWIQSSMDDGLPIPVRFESMGIPEILPLNRIFHALLASEATLCARISSAFPAFGDLRAKIPGAGRICWLPVAVGRFPRPKPSTRSSRRTRSDPVSPPRAPRPPCFKVRAAVKRRRTSRPQHFPLDNAGPNAQPPAPTSLWPRPTAPSRTASSSAS